MNITRTQTLRDGLVRAYELDREGKHIESIEVLLKDMPEELIQEVHMSDEEKWIDHHENCVGCSLCDNPGL